MKRSILSIGIVVILGTLFILQALEVQTWDVRANEYFGDGVMVSFRLPTSGGQRSAISSQQFAGVIQAWGWYAIYGNADGCRIMPLLSPVGDAATVPCGMTFNDKTTAFRGRYDFRGHPRPFCGALTGKGLPEKCLGE